MAEVELSETTELKKLKSELKEEDDKIKNDNQKEKKLIDDVNVQENPLRKTPLTEDDPEDPQNNIFFRNEDYYYVCHFESHLNRHTHF